MAWFDWLRGRSHAANPDMEKMQQIRQMRVCSGEPKKLVADLTEELQNPDATVRRAAAEALPMFGATAFDSLPAVTELLKDKTASVRVAAVNTLGEFGPLAQDAVPTLTSMLNARDIEERFASAEALARIKPLEECAAVLVNGLRQDYDKRQRAACAIGNLGSLAMSAIPDLIDQLAGRIHSENDAVVNGLAKIGAPAVGPLIRALEYGDSSVRYGAAATLGVMGPAAAPAVPALVRALEGKNWKCGWRRRLRSARLARKPTELFQCCLLSPGKTCGRARHSAGSVPMPLRRCSNA